MNSIYYSLHTYGNIGPSGPGVLPGFAKVGGSVIATHKYNQSVAAGWPRPLDEAMLTVLMASAAGLVF